MAVMFDGRLSRLVVTRRTTPETIGQMMVGLFAAAAAALPEARP